MNEFTYVAHVQVAGGKVDKVYESQWALTDPRFNPEDHTPNGQMGTAEAILKLANNDMLPEDGFYVIKADGDMRFDFSEERSVTICEVSLKNPHHQPMDQSMLYRWEDEAIYRPVYVDVEYKLKKTDKDPT